MSQHSCGNSQLRTLFLKSENSMQGRYFAELTDQVLRHLKNARAGKSCSEYRVSVYVRLFLRTHSFQRHHLAYKISGTEAMPISGKNLPSGHVDTISLPKRIDGWYKYLESIEYFARLERSNHFRIFWTTFSSLFLLQRLNPRSIPNSRVFSLRFPVLTVSMMRVLTNLKILSMM